MDEGPLTCWGAAALQASDVIRPDNGVHDGRHFLRVIARKAVRSTSARAFRRRLERRKGAGAGGRAKRRECGGIEKPALEMYNGDISFEQVMLANRADAQAAAAEEGSELALLKSCVARDSRPKLLPSSISKGSILRIILRATSLRQPVITYVWCAHNGLKERMRYPTVDVWDDQRKIQCANNEVLPSNDCAAQSVLVPTASQLSYFVPMHCT